MRELEFGSRGAEEISVFHRLPFVKGTKPLRLAPCPSAMPLQARLLPPVPPEPLPPEPPLFVPEDEIPEQAVKLAIGANSVKSSRGSFQPDPGRLITEVIVDDDRRIRKRPFGHVPIPAAP